MPEIRLEPKDGTHTFYADSRLAWRQWLEEHHACRKAVWLIIYKKSSPIPSVYYDEAVDEALCFGWIDSKPNKRDKESYFQYFSQRNPKSKWSRVNKDKVSRLIEEGRMTAAGLKMIDLAKKSGIWSALDEVDHLIIPSDMQLLLEQNPKAKYHWELHESTP